MEKIMSWIIWDVAFEDWIRRSISFLKPIHWLHTEESMANLLKDNIAHIAPFKQFQIDGTHMLYSHLECTPYSRYNTIIEVNIPYVLHVPSFTKLHLVTPKESTVFLQKIWTNRSTGSFDFEAISDEILYYRGGTFISPEMPHNPFESWNWKIPESKNIDEVNPTWNLRYTKITIHFNSDFTHTEAKWSTFHDECLLKINNDALDIVNKIISTYRNKLEMYSISLLNHVEIMDIYFPRWWFGYYPLKFNVWDAIINRERWKVNSFIEKLNSIDDIPTYDLLIDNSKTSLILRDFKGVVIESFSATDLFVEFLINTLLIKSWKTLVDIGVDESKWPYWSTRLWLWAWYELFFWKTFRSEFPDIYKAWTVAHIKIRNKVVHNWYNPNEQEANESLSVNESLLNILKTKL